MNLDTAHLTIITVAAAVGVLGTVFGWFGKIWRWGVALFRPKLPAGTIEIPSRTLIVQPKPHPNAFWWHMGSSAGQPAMQIVGDVTVTNISNYKVLTTASRLRKPQVIGQAHRMRLNSRDSDDEMIDARAIADVRINFWVMPPFREANHPFRADIAIVDQFGNEHWLKNVEFKYT